MPTYLTLFSLSLVKPDRVGGAGFVVKSASVVLLVSSVEQSLFEYAL